MDLPLIAVCVVVGGFLMLGRGKFLGGLSPKEMSRVGT